MKIKASRLREGRTWVLRIGAAMTAVVATVTVAYAGNLVTWSSGQTLKAADLNSNFCYLQSEIAALQTQVQAGTHVFVTDSTEVEPSRSLPSRVNSRASSP
jgi:hypothetical protein